VSDVSQRAGFKTAEDEVSDIHNPSKISDHYTAEILKKSLHFLMAGLRQKRWS
jgi:hypothetical protein